MKQIHTYSWDFPVVQWLRLHAPNAGAWVQSLDRELDSFPLYSITKY